MSPVPRLPSRAWWLLLCVALAGCASVFNYQPAETRGGFVVPVDVPGQPNSARVAADVGAFARQRGFVRQGAPPAPQVDPTTHQPLAPASERYMLGKITLDIIYQSDHLRVAAYLHSFSHQLSQNFIDSFYRDFSQRYAGIYGGEGSIVETDYSSDTGGPPRGGGGHRGGGHGGGGGSGSGG